MHHHTRGSFSLNNLIVSHSLTCLLQEFPKTLKRFLHNSFIFFLVCVWGGAPICYTIIREAEVGELLSGNLPSVTLPQKEGGGGERILFGMEYTSVIPLIWRLNQEEHKFKAILAIYQALVSQ